MLHAQKYTLHIKKRMLLAQKYSLTERKCDRLKIRNFACHQEKQMNHGTYPINFKTQNT